jgi:hypothetical protein
MRLTRRAGTWATRLRLLAVVLVALSALSGCAKKPRSLAGIGVGLPPGEVGDPCAVPNTGCACETDGEEIECGSTVAQAGDTLTCKKGTRVCEDSKWSECLNTHLEEQTIHRGATQWRPFGLGSQASCPNGYDDCDPYCNYQNDVPDSLLDAGTGFTSTDAGLTLTQTGSGGCNSITMALRTPSTTTDMVVTGLSTFATDQTGNKINFQVTASPAGCITAPFDVTWTIDKFDRAAVSGTKSNDGAVTLALGVAGPINVTAYGAGHVASMTMNVRVNVVEAPSTESTAATPNRKTTATLQNLFGANCSTGAATCRNAPTTGSGTSTASYLYPYPATWFPLGLVPPVIQYTYNTATGNGQATKVSLRYPKNQTLANVTAGTTAFNYSVIVAETNNYRQYADCGSGCAQVLDPQVILPQTAWSAFERTVRGYGDTTGDYDADILVQRAKSSAVELEYRWPTAIHFAGGYLKGTVYYNSYNSTAGGSTATNVVGAVLKINPGSTTSTPTAAISGSAGKCTGCHSVSADGSTLTLASGDTNGSGCTGAALQGGTYRENTCSWNMPAATLKKTHLGTSADPYKFLWGASYPDGSFYLSNVLDNTRILQSGYPSGGAYALTPGLYRTADGASLTAGGVPGAPVTPAFSSDGTYVAYNQGTLSGNIANPAVVVSENQACSVAVGTKPSEVSACGQPYGLTLSEIASCPGVTLSEISSCGSSPGGVNVSEVASCGLASSGVISEVHPCNGSTAFNGVVISEISPRVQFGGAAGESVELRNDGSSTVNIGSWTVRSTSTTCFTVTAGTTLLPGASLVLNRTTACLPDASGTARIYNSGGTLQNGTNQTHAYTTSSSSNPRSVLSCAGTWTESAAGNANDATNTGCSVESVEIRNDTAGTLDISGWTVNSGATVCGTVPASTTLASGAVYLAYAFNCLSNTGATLTLKDSGGTTQNTRAYTASGCSATAQKRSVLSCVQVWTDNQSPGADDATNNACIPHFEWVEIRNDTPSSVNLSGWTVRNGAGTTCVTVPASTTRTSGQVYRAYTSGACFTDAGDTIRIYDSAGTLQGSRAFTSTCSATTPRRGQLSCGGSWSNDLALGGNDTANENCAESAVAEWVEIRNDTQSSLGIAGWTVRSGGTTCATVPTGVTLAAGASYPVYTTSGSCLPDASGTLTIHNSSGAQQGSARVYASSCTAAVGNRSVLSCSGARTDNVATAVNDTTNDACTNKEGVDIRNDTTATVNVSGYTIRNSSGTTCATVPTTTNLAPGATYHADTGMCLTDGTGTVYLHNSGGTVLSSRAYNVACTPTQQRSVLACGGTWTEPATPSSAAFDTTNDTCASQQFEMVEIRNDTTATVDISNWTVRNGAGTTCGTVPASTSLTSGSTYRVYISSGACLTDGSSSASIHNAAGTLQSSQAYTAACGQRATLSCGGTWTNSQAVVGNDTTNDSCAASQSYEWIEIRNDTSVTVDVSGWTVRNASGTTCLTVPGGTTLAAGGVYLGYTPTGGCMPDASGTLSVYDAASPANLQSTQAYTSTCTVSTPKRGYLPCPSSSYVWANDQTPAAAQSGNNNCTFSGSYDSSGTTLRTKTFSCGATGGSVACVGSTKTFSNETTVVNCADAAQAGHVQCTRPSYPSFLPDKSGLLYQHQITDSGFESGVNSAYGATAEIWITRPTSKTPVPLDKLNGWDGSSAVSIPTRPRNSALPLPTGAGGTYDVTWHPSTATSTPWYFDSCASSTAQSTTTREDRFNYFPVVSPQEAGGAYWAIFTSRRMYGNVAISNPWQVQRSDNSANRFGLFTGSCPDAYSPGSGFIETKKLWVSAIDKNWSGSGDPSHPPFYLPGQELEAGNSHGYWVSDACAAEGASCETDDDCCYGTGSGATHQCKITNTSVVPPTRQCHPIADCSDVGEACTTSANCCTGLTCPAGGGVCLEVGGTAFTAATYRREYIASCPTGTRVKWKNFEWQATLPTGTQIDFYVQTKKLAADSYLPTTAALLKSALPPPPTGWDFADVDAVLKANNLASLDYLRVSMTFRPDSAATLAPTLKNWRIVYDCLPAE